MQKLNKNNKLQDLINIKDELNHINFKIKSSILKSINPASICNYT